MRSRIILRTDQIEVVVSEFPVVEYHVAREKMHAHCTQLMTWARLCKAIGTPFMLIGTFGKKWHNQVIDQAVEDGILTRITSQIVLNEPGI